MNAHARSSIQARRETRALAILPRHAPLSIGALVRCRRLRADELSIFADHYRRCANLSCDLDYLVRAEVWAAFDGDGIMHGGWALNCAPPFRYVSAVPAGSGPSWTPPLDATCELACAWFDPTLTQPERISLYLRMVASALATGRRYFMAGTTNPKIMAVHRQCLPRLIYAGAPDVAAEIVANHHIYVYVGTLATMVAGYLRAAARRCLGMPAPAWARAVDSLYKPAERR